uniref:DDE Tnp4 domain-containing protein n=1 Tax=Oryza glumipatula TaxID=40148 RepID=A0A0D9YAZ5_9ORYZ
MRSTSGARPSSGGGGGDDDYAFYYSFFQDAAAAAASPLGLDDAAAMTNGGRKRKRGGGGDGADGGAPAASRKDGPGGDGEGGNGRKRSIAKILTSLAALEAEDHSDRAGAADASRRELALLESNADHKSQAMMDYYAKMEGSFDAAAESDAAARSKRSRLAASAATAAVVATEEGAAETASASASPSRASGGGGAGHHQRRLWVKDRSRAWWDKCNSPDYPEEEFRRAFRMGRETFDMICEALGSAISVAAYFNRRHTERNQKTSYSITLQGVVGPDGAFTDVCIGWPGSMPDDQVLEKSMLHQRAAAGMMHSACLVGGASYPLMDWVLVPYTHQNLTWTQHAFNEKVGDLRRVAVDAFARLKARWACLQKRTEVKLQDLPVVLGACCVLHNICETRGEELEPELRFELVDDETSPETPVRSEAAKRARDNIAHNLLHRGFAGTTFF